MGLASTVLRTRWLVRSPVALFRTGLGGVFAGRLLLLVHRGRSSGQPRYAVLEVASRPAPDRYVVVAGLGPRTQWYRNVVAEPRVLVRTGARPAVRAFASTLDPDDAARLLAEYPVRSPRAWSTLEPVLREWAEPLAASRGVADWRRVVPVVELTPVHRGPVGRARKGRSDP
ncbi:nitroreductase family deazaflavin-dependent oxidoreductase [Cellulosimicrobium cellulans]|uniref:nitroreductase family deazaflavin-dependent oxidoreductase n=1 Tax=Cellulosimicrobium cellulans TaxID=1710 RepID=UPI0008496E1F|nr:nitroreductase family deazaflavin-dependent oxidoreductase [Cellulosimicrobium cellulans]